MRRILKCLLVPAFAAFFTAAPALANNLQITNVVIKGLNDECAYIQFDISWENSWRHASHDDPLYMHDAAWVFFKFKPAGELEWQHAVLQGDGLNPPDFVCGTGTPIDIVVPDDHIGMIVRRSQDGEGTTEVQRVKAVWNFSAADLTVLSKVSIRAFGLEMVYVAEGPFWVGDGMNDAGQLFEGGGGTTPFLISSPDAIECGNDAGKLWGASTSGDSSMGGAGIIPAEFPKGYKAFYCMKYEITQGQYADFLNHITRVQQATRCLAILPARYMSDAAGGSVTVVYRNLVRLTFDFGDPQARIYTVVTPDRACNYINWPDVAAFADWAGLRPMTELELEKACRGPMPPIPGEFAWGSTVVVPQTGHAGLDGSGEEQPLPYEANCVCNDLIQGPVRVGLFAQPHTSREQAGASYWGIMNLGDNLRERPVSIGNATGRNFTGLHGNGVLTPAGDADVTLWPPANATGSGIRGGACRSDASQGRTSYRAYAAQITLNRTYNTGGRAVRTAPE